MKQVPVGDRTVIVRVEQVLEAPKSFAHYRGQDITVELAGTKAVRRAMNLFFMPTAGFLATALPCARSGKNGLPRDMKRF